LKVKVTGDKKRQFLAFSAARVQFVFGETSLAASFGLCRCDRMQRSLLLSVVELKAASWLATGDSSPSEQDDKSASSSHPDAPADAMQNVVEYSDDEDDVDYTDRNFEIV